jgi:molybdopterin synthase sulfur carrier subunit
MFVLVRGFARFGELIGRERKVEAPAGTTLLGLLADLARASPALEAELFDPDRRIRDYVILMRNRRRVENADAPAVELQDGDEIAVFPPVAGG